MDSNKRGRVFLKYGDIRKSFRINSITVSRILLQFNIPEGSSIYLECTIKNDTYVEYPDNKGFFVIDDYDCIEFSIIIEICVAPIIVQDMQIYSNSESNMSEVSYSLVNPYTQEGTKVYCYCRESDESQRSKLKGQETTARQYISENKWICLGVKSEVRSGFIENCSSLLISLLEKCKEQNAYILFVHPGRLTRNLPVCDYVLESGVPILTVYPEDKTDLRTPEDFRNWIKYFASKETQTIKERERMAMNYYKENFTISSERIYENGPIIGSFDIETTGPLGRGCIGIISLAIDVGDVYVFICSKKKVKSVDIEGIIVYWYEHEVEMIEGFINTLGNYEDLTLIGYNIFSFDWPFIKERIEKLGIDINILFGPIGKSGKSVVPILENINSIDLFRYVRAILTPESSTLDAITDKELGRGKYPLQPSRLMYYMEKCIHMDMVATYCAMDSILVLELERKFNSYIFYERKSLTLGLPIEHISMHIKDLTHCIFAIRLTQQLERLDDNTEYIIFLLENLTKLLNKAVERYEIYYITKHVKEYYSSSKSKFRHLVHSNQKEAGIVYYTYRNGIPIPIEDLVSIENVDVEKIYKRSIVTNKYFRYVMKELSISLECYESIHSCMKKLAELGNSIIN